MTRADRPDAAPARPGPAGTMPADPGLAGTALAGTALAGTALAGTALAGTGQLTRLALRRDRIALPATATTIT